MTVLLNTENWLKLLNENTYKSKPRQKCQYLKMSLLSQKFAIIYIVQILYKTTKIFQSTNWYTMNYVQKVFI